MTTMGRLSPFSENLLEVSPQLLELPPKIDDGRLLWRARRKSDGPPSLELIARRLAGVAMRLGVPSDHVLSLTGTVISGLRGGVPASAPRRLTGIVSRAVQGVRDMYTLARHAETRRPERLGEADIVEARLLASRWQSRAECAERRIAELERRLACSEMAALDLRSRVVCLHGKLATSTATARYQVLTHALENGTQGTALDRVPTPGSVRA